MITFPEFQNTLQTAVREDETGNKRRRYLARLKEMDMLTIHEVPVEERQAFIDYVNEIDGQAVS